MALRSLQITSPPTTIAAPPSSVMQLRHFILPRKSWHSGSNPSQCSRLNVEWRRFDGQ
jgi:hypothetical protein